jgi:molybdenum cofactor biosynthesis enzyme MoaA
MLDLKLPAVCDFSVTNVCNAACDFCGFARDKTLIGPARYVDADAFSRALPILHRRGIRYMTLQGGEPLVHPDIVRLVSQTVTAGMSCAIIPNGWFLPLYIDPLAAAGLSRLIVSMTAPNSRSMSAIGAWRDWSAVWRRASRGRVRAAYRCKPR